MLSNYCAFSHDHECIKWEDYEFARSQLEEADELCHGNWIEIQKFYDYIDGLYELLDANNIPYERFIC